MKVLKFGGTEDCCPFSYVRYDKHIGGNFGLSV